MEFRAVVLDVRRTFTRLKNGQKVKNFYVAIKDATPPCMPNIFDYRVRKEEEHLLSKLSQGSLVTITWTDWDTDFSGRIIFIGFLEISK